jgi:hypothetical protein
MYSPEMNREVEGHCLLLEPYIKRKNNYYYRGNGIYYDNGQGGRFNTPNDNGVGNNNMDGPGGNNNNNMGGPGSPPFPPGGRPNRPPTFNDTT